MPSPDTSYDVIIAGAGPVGLLLACELRLAGISVLVLEREAEANSQLKGLPFGLRGLTVPTVESLDRRDLLAALEERAASDDTRTAAHWTQQQRRPAGHFAGIQFFHDQIDAARWPYRLAGPIGSIAADMATIEGIFCARAEALGADIQRGRDVGAVDATAAGVIVRTADMTFHGRWLVGCDGGRSSVRKAARFDFAGTEPKFTGYSVRAELSDRTRLKAGRHYTPAGMYTFTAPGTIAMVDFDGGACHRTELTREHIEALLRRISGTGVAVTALHYATTWTDRAYQAASYRRGRVLLAGDAAHIHSPLGGQGLNLGLGDAMNLGWKLAATIRGDAPAGLLDSYERERHPIGEQVLDWSRAQVAVMRPDASARALEAIMRDLIATRDGANYFAERVWGVGLRYDLGDRHPLVGRSMPNFRFRDGSTANAQLRAGTGLLIDFDRTEALQVRGSAWGDRIVYVAQDCAERLGVAALLVRPDGIVAWACDGPPDADQMAHAAARWFGEPGAPPR